MSPAPAPSRAPHVPDPARELHPTELERRLEAHLLIARRIRPS